MTEKLRTFISESPEDTEELARELASLFKSGDIILLEGDLGSGKTFLVQRICQYWNIKEEVTSPTFAIMQHYTGDVAVNHFDFYRLNDASELENLGWEEIAYGGGVTFIEWPQLVKERIGPHYLIKIIFTGNKRQFDIFKSDH